MAFLRIIGDVHGKHTDYNRIAAKAEYSLQVGDMGFNYDDLNLDITKHKIIGGNHDNYTKSPCNCKDGCEICEGRGYLYKKQSKHFLGDYGVWNPIFSIYYVRGAWSIDWEYRIPEISWWGDEELPARQMIKAFEKYVELKPKFVVSHTAPLSIVPSIPFERIFGDKIHQPATETLLEQMYNAHQPDIWVFGHWHCDWDSVKIHPVTNNKTRFICLNELSYKDFSENGVRNGNC